MIVRAAEAAEMDQLARLWYEGWCDAHASLVSPELVRARTLENFRERLGAALPATRVAGPAGAALGLCVIKDDELNQLFVARAARGSAVASMLLADGEARLAEHGVATAWLFCLVGNDRAARFYEKRGWHRAGTMANRLDTPSGIFHVDVWRYEKALAKE